MKLRTAACSSLILAACAAAPALAQEAGAAGDASAKPIVVTANFQARIAVDPSAPTTEVTKALAQANQSLGEIANRECDVLAAAFKTDCRVGQLNMSANVNDRRIGQMMNAEFGGSQRLVNASLNATFELTPPAAAAKGAPNAQ
jgi:hypothetical protein